MKKNIISILAATFVSVTAIAAATDIIPSTQQFRGADGDVEYAVAQQENGKFKMSFKVIADDKDSELMRILNSGKDIYVSTSSERLFTTKVVEKSKLRGVVVAMLESEAVDESRMNQLMSAHGETLRLGAEGFALVMFPAEGEVVFTDLKRVMHEFAQTVESAKTQETIPVAPVTITPPAPTAQQPVTNSVEKPEETTKPAEQPATKLSKLEAALRNLQESPVSVKNENGLFKITGTSVPSSTNMASSKMHFVHQQLMKAGQCNTAAMNMSTGGIFIYKGNGYAYSSNLPIEFVTNIKSFNRPNCQIKDIALTESNKWVIIYERNGYKTSAKLPQALVDKLGAANLANEQIRNVSLNDNGDWLLITNKGISSSNGAVADFLARAKEAHGKVEAAFISSNGAMMAMCKNGVYCHRVPMSVIEAMKTIQFVPKMIKFTDVGYYIITNGKDLVKYSL